MSNICHFRFTEVVVPARSEAINSKNVDKPLHMLPVVTGGKAAWETQFDALPKLMIEMTLENGVVGFGECYRDHDWRVIENTARALLGQSLISLNRKALPVPLVREYDGFECAIWDAYAKTKDMRVVDLLGGPVRNSVKVGAWSSYRHPGEMGEVAHRFQKMGYDFIKLKAGLDDDVVAWAEEIKRSAPGMQIIYDPNQRWENLGETKRLARALEKVGNVFCLEDPIPHWMMRDYATLRSITSIRIVRHISLPYIYQGQRPHDAINVLQHHAADGFNFNGGLVAFQQLDHISSAANMYCWHGSELDLGILEAMYVHQSAAAKSCIWPGDIFGRLIREHDLLASPLRMEPPFVQLPEGPGLGVILDQEALLHYQTRVVDVS